jgi:ribonuclease E
VSDDSSTATPESTPAPRRRRAAGRPAGPPAAASETTAAPAPTEAAEAPAEAPAAAKATKAPAKKAAKKAAAKAAPAADEAAAPAKKTARKATKKAAAAPAAEAAELSAADAPSVEAAPAKRTRSRKAAPAVPAFSEPVAPVAADAPEAPAAGLLMFQAPSAAAPSVEAPPSRRRTRATKKEAPAVEVVEDVEELEADAAAEALEADVEAELESDEADAESDDDSGAPRRRRRRGGRGRRRRSGSDVEGSDETDAEGVADAAAEGAETSGADAAADEEGSGGSSRRRRRRRRGGSDAEDGQDDPPNTVTRVREPRQRSASSEITSVKGSTRLEAKKQRRREGRDSGRRRPSILTEAEFLARREAVDRVMVVRQRDDRTQIAVLEDGVLVEHYVNRNTGASMIGNVYLGKVQNVLPSMEAAFVDIGRGRNAVLYAGEVNWDAAGLQGQPKRIEAALKPGDPVLVQVSKDPIGHKGARLTAQVSLPGRFLVYVPEGSMTGISRKLPDTERSRLKSILRQVVPDEAGVIVRTAAEGASEEELRRDVERLTAQWTEIEEKVAKGSSGAPMLLHGEPDLAIKVVRDIFNEDFGKLVVEGDAAWEPIQDYVTGIAPELADRIEKWVGPGDLFTSYRIDEQLAKALDRKVWLPSGGSLVIDRTEAMTVVDVNTGKFTGQGGNLEETVTRNNLEAAEEIVRQLRLRDIGGIIVVDFIDMVLESNRDLVLRRLLECLGRDRTKHQVAEVTSLGLVQMTRKKIGQGLLEVFSEPCEACQGRGYHVHSEPVASKGGGSEESEGPAGRSRKRKAADAEPAGKGKKGKKSSASAPKVEVEPRAIDPAVSAAMEKIHAAAAKKAADAAEAGETLPEGAQDAAGAPADDQAAPEAPAAPEAAQEAPEAPAAPAKRTRGPRKATRKAGPAAVAAGSEGGSGESA